MKRLFLLAAILVSTMATGASAQVGPPPPPPTAWYLHQNDPDPLCAATRFQFGLAQDAHAQFAVWNADQTAIIRLFADGMLPAGVHAVAWNGRDGAGEVEAGNPGTDEPTRT